MKLLLKKILIWVCVIIFIAIGFFLLIKFGWEWLAGWLGLGGGSAIAGWLKRRPKTYEINNVLKEVRRKNEKVDNGDYDAISSSLDNIVSRKRKD